MGKIFTEKRKRDLLVYLILWLIFAIVFVVPAAVAKVDSTYNGSLKMDSFLQIIIDYILSLEVRVKAFQEAYINTTMLFVRNYSLVYVIFAIILMLKSKDSAYHNIEHGSSDWSVGGEQYKVLSKNKGILLAEKNYLPVDKKGNVNVLIVGRIWCW
jgi:hypothetical protein